MNKVNKMKKNYVVENDSDEADVLHELEQEGFKWAAGVNPTELIISRLMGDEVFPYTISIGKYKKIYWSAEDNEEADKMNKYSIRQSLMQDLKNWQDDRRIYADNDAVVSWEDFQNEPPRVTEWRLNTGSAIEANNRLITIIKWLNGEDVFSVDQPSYIVRKKGEQKYINVEDDNEFLVVDDKRNATVFYTLEGAKKWENPMFEAVELDE